jgi:hypothetical protein
MAMLAWALWVSFWLVGLLKRDCKKFMAPTLWYRLPPRIKKRRQNRSPHRERTDTSGVSDKGL